MSERGFNIRPDSSPQDDPNVRESELLNEIGADLAVANRELRSTRGMMDQAVKDNDREALDNWQRKFTEQKERVDMLAQKLADKVSENRRLKNYVKADSTHN